MTDGVIRVFLPLTYRKKNGRPRIVAAPTEPTFQAQKQDPHILRLLGQAWSWRRQMEAGATLADTAKAAGLSDRYVSRVVRLAYLSPEVHERLLLWRTPPAVSVNELYCVSSIPWAEQSARALGEQT
jgi:hypothetical protein